MFGRRHGRQQSDLRGIQRLQQQQCHVGGRVCCGARQIAGHCGAEAAFPCVQAKREIFQVNNGHRGEERDTQSKEGRTFRHSGNVSSSAVNF